MNKILQCTIFSFLIHISFSSAMQSPNQKYSECNESCRVYRYFANSDNGKFAEAEHKACLRKCLIAYKSDIKSNKPDAIDAAVIHEYNF